MQLITKTLITMINKNESILWIEKFCVHLPKVRISIAYKPDLRYLLQFIVRVVINIFLVSCSSNTHGIHLTIIYFQIIWKKSSLVPRLIFYCIKISRMHISSIMRYAVASLIRTCVLLDVRNRPLKGKYNKLLIDWNIYFYGFQLQINIVSKIFWQQTLRLSNNRILLAIGNSLQTYHQSI